jgi:hypothetical protein
MACTRSMSKGATKASSSVSEGVPVRAVKYIAVERRFVSKIRDLCADDISLSDDGGVPSLCSGDMVRLEDVMEAEEADDEQAVRSRSCPSHLLPHGDFAGYLYSFNEHGMFRCPHCDKRRSKGKVSDLENCLKLKREREDQE